MTDFPDLAPLSTCTAGLYELHYANGDIRTIVLSSEAVHEVINHMLDYSILSIAKIN